VDQLDAVFEFGLDTLLGALAQQLATAKPRPAARSGGRR
jgi:hypothetical protein